MLYVAVIFGIIAVAGVIIASMMIALRCLQSAVIVAEKFVVAHRATLNSLERTHKRNVDQNGSVLDRFMALDFSLFKSYQLTEAADAGGFSEPEDEGEDESTGTITYTPGGNVVLHGEALADRLRQRMEEEQILAEDFDEAFFEREDTK